MKTNDLDDLLSTLNNTRGKVATSNHNKPRLLTDMENFIKDNNIRVGTKAVDMKYVYGLYCGQNRTPMSRRMFGTYFMKFFEVKRWPRFHGCRLEYDSFNLPPNYSAWAEQYSKRKPFTPKKSRHRNITHTPSGWMVYLDIKDRGRLIYDFYKSEEKAAIQADELAYTYFGESYLFYNFPKRILKKVKGYDNQEEKDSIQKST
jgi:hypothetical protein